MTAACDGVNGAQGGTPQPTPAPGTPAPGTPSPNPGTGAPGTSQPGTSQPGTTPGTGTSPTTPTGPETPAEPPQEADVLPTPKRTLVAKSLDELKGFIGSARPGDRIELVDGTYTSSAAIEVSLQGTEADPIVITAQNVGGATIGGAASFRISDSQHVVLRGFKLTHGVEEEGVAFELLASQHVRITRNEFALQDETANSTWFRIEGAGSGYNRIDHNHFHDKTSSNVFMAVYGDAPDGGLGISQHDRIDHNYFESLTLPEEGGECLRVGDSKRGPIAAHTVVESNLFEKCNGDPEVISNKSSENIFRGNTLRNNAGSLVLRHGNKSIVDGNFIIGNVGGMRVYGHDHVITNNYIENNSGSGAQSTLILNSGCTETDTGNGSDCSVSTRVTVAFNTLVGNTKTHLAIGSTSSSRPIPPRDSRIENNIIQGDQGTLVDFAMQPDGFTASGNILWGSAAVGDMPSSGFVKVDPRLVRTQDGLFRPSAGSPAVGGAILSTGSLKVTTDMDGTPRVGALDAGADQGTSLAPARRPLTPADVGPKAP